MGTKIETKMENYDSLEFVTTTNKAKAVENYKMVDFINISPIGDSLVEVVIEAEGERVTFVSPAKDLKDDAEELDSNSMVASFFKEAIKQI